MRSHVFLQSITLLERRRTDVAFVALLVQVVLQMHIQFSL